MFQDIKNPEELYNFIRSNINYGFVSNENIIYIRDKVNEEIYMNDIIEKYYLQSPMELLKSKCGICYDQVELANLWFIMHGYQVLNCFTNYHNHAMVLYLKNNKYYWLETTLINHMGIHEYNSLEDFYKDLLIVQKKEIIELYYFKKVKYGCGFNTYIDNIVNNNQKILIRKSC